MAEGVLEGLVGEPEDESPDVEPASPPLADAVALAEARGSEEARAYLADARRFIGVQMEHLHEQRAVLLSQLKLKRTSVRLRIGFQVLASVLVSGLAIGVLAMAWSASRDHGLVVEPFAVPPELAARGLTGQVVARRVLDRLVELQTQTESMRAPDTYHNNWGDDLKVEIPETGVSLGELKRYLQAWLGHQTHISGEIYRNPTGFTVNARAGDAPATSASGSDAQLEGLIQRTGETLFAQTQPYRYATYLDDHGRLPEALAILLRLVNAPAAIDRAWAYNGLAAIDGIQGNAPARTAHLRAALKEVPGFGPAISNLMGPYETLGHDEAALLTANAVISHRDLIDRYVRDERRRGLIIFAAMTRAMLLGDYVDAMNSLDRLHKTRVPRDNENANSDLAEVLQLGHNTETIRRIAARVPAGDEGYRLDLLSWAAFEDGDPASITLRREELKEDLASPQFRESALRAEVSSLALAEARFGQVSDAWTRVQTTPLDCYICVRARGTIAAARGDRAGSLRWFAEAIRQAPDLPQAFVERGTARLGWGDAAGALDDAKLANRRSPRDADALKLWADALVRLGNAREALVKYNVVMRYTPAWKAARLARERAVRAAA